MKRVLTFFFTAFALLIFSIGVTACGQQVNTDAPPKDTITIKGLNEHNEYVDLNGDLNDICFTKITIADTFLDEANVSTAIYLILEGVIETPNYAFDLQRANLEFFADNNSIFYIPINEEFSCEVTDIPLFFNNNAGEMKGSFRLVFVLDDENLEKYKSIEMSDEQTSKFCFYLNPWGKDKAEFVFYKSEIHFIDKY